MSGNGRRVTAAMVAAHAGTSVSTVSLVVNGKARGRVSETIADRVRRSVSELGYVVDHAASSLARGRSDLVVLLAPDLPNPFFGDVVAGVRAGLGERYHLMLSTPAGTGTQPAAEDVARVAALRPTGLLVHAPSPSLLDDLSPDGPPLVLLDARAPGHDAVTFDFGPGVDALLTHLAALGHRRIAYLDGTTPSATFAVRRELLASRAGAHGLTVLGDEVRADVTLDAAADTAVGALPRWLDDGATAVVAAADTLAYGVLAAAARLGLAVPDDVSVAGFDDLPYSQITAPALTSVGLPGHALGRAAARRLTAVLDGDDAAPPVSPIARLAVRHSTAPPPGSGDGAAS
ncbi:LacI family DNA-binding transcriptional regulator [Pseudonocardia phyllosphaerae]|uniref:LacI family DNA-binding transcriptional regulator n=1 Tax=Pseudonocardia phyllosphaerae TaxID=3390502 RepID=UPI003979819E